MRRSVYSSLCRVVAYVRSSQQVVAAVAVGGGGVAAAAVAAVQPWRGARLFLAEEVGRKGG